MQVFFCLYNLSARFLFLCVFMGWEQGISQGNGLTRAGLDCLDCLKATLDWICLWLNDGCELVPLSHLTSTEDHWQVKYHVFSGRFLTDPSAWGSYTILFNVIIIYANLTKNHSWKGLWRSSSPTLCCMGFHYPYNCSRAKSLISISPKLRILLLMHFVLDKLNEYPMSGMMSSGLSPGAWIEMFSVAVSQVWTFVSLET